MLHCDFFNYRIKNNKNVMYHVMNRISKNYGDSQVLEIFRTWKEM